MRNILMIVVDDLRPQLGCYGHPTVLSPHLDRIAADGITFTRAYCQQAVCAPSRASVFSGCRPDTTRIFNLQTPLTATIPDCVTLPHYMRTQGLHSLSIGKTYHHKDEDPKGWSEPPHVTKGDWLGRGYLTDEAIEAMHLFNTAAEQSGKEDRRGLGPATECADVDDEAYHDGKEATRAIDVLRQQPKDRPFFLALGFHKPHLPFAAPKKYWDLYDRATLPLAANPQPITNAHPWTIADFGELRGYTDMPKNGPLSEAEARRLIHGYHACISYMDAQVGRVLAELEALGLRDTTSICVWGDHGWKLGEHASWCKHSNTEIDTNAPLLISTPELRGKGQTCDALVEFVDIYPTCAALAGLPIPEHCEGSDLTALLHNPQRPWKKAAFSQYPREDQQLHGYAMRTQDFRYVEWRSTIGKPTEHYELYDHRSDPHENTNCANDPAYANDLKQCQAQMAAGWQAERAALTT